jgi:hypothetical protein
LDKHIKAKGSASISPTNPHGISAEDLGIFPNDTVGTHQENFHASGVVNGDTTSTSSSLYPYISGTSLKISPLTSTEKISVKAGTYGSTSPVTYHGISADTSTTFSTEYNTGPFFGASLTYYFYIDVSTPATPVLTFSTSLPSGDNYYIICSVDWNGIALSNKVDYRIFWNQKPVTIWPTISRRQITGSVGFNKTLSSLEVYDGTNWIALNEEFISTDQTGSQTIAHGLTGTPDIVIVTMRSAGSAWESGPADGTNVYVTASSGSAHYKVYAKRRIVT